MHCARVRINSVYFSTLLPKRFMELTSKAAALSATPACLRALAYERVDELIGKNMHELIHHTRADGTLLPVEECRIFRAFRTGEGVHVEDEVLWRANGTSFPVEYWSHPQRRGGEVVGAVIAFVDITDRKLTEAALAGLGRRLIEAQEQERRAYCPRAARRFESNGWHCSKSAWSK